MRRLVLALAIVMLAAFSGCSGKTYDGGARFDGVNVKSYKLPVWATHEWAVGRIEAYYDTLPEAPEGEKDIMEDGGKTVYEVTGVIEIDKKEYIWVRMGVDRETYVTHAADYFIPKSGGAKEGYIDEEGNGRFY